MRRVFLIIIFFCLCKANSQEIETKLLWLENSDGFYSTSEDTFCGMPGFVDASSNVDTITISNYFQGYYVFYLLGLSSDEDFLKSRDIDSSFFYPNYNIMDTWFMEQKDESQNIQVKYNKNWMYTLFAVTYKKKYIGIIDRIIPNLFKVHKNENLLTYSKVKIPVYAIQIIHIQPLKKKDIDYFK